MTDSLRRAVQSAVMLPGETPRAWSQDFMLCGCKPIATIAGVPVVVVAHHAETKVDRCTHCNQRQTYRWYKSEPTEVVR